MPLNRWARTCETSTLAVRIAVSSASARRGPRGTQYRADHCDVFRRPAWFRSRSALPPAKRAASTADRAAVVLTAPSIPVRTISRGDSFRRGKVCSVGARPAGQAPLLISGCHYSNDGPAEVVPAGLCRGATVPGSRVRCPGTFGVPERSQELFAVGRPDFTRR